MSKESYIREIEEEDMENEIKRFLGHLDEEEEYDEFESSSTHLFATYDNRVVGTCRFRNTSQGTKLERFAVLKEYRTQSVGASLLKAALAAVDHDRMIYLHAQVQVVEFYNK